MTICTFQFFCPDFGRFHGIPFGSTGAVEERAAAVHGQSQGGHLPGSRNRWSKESKEHTIFPCFAKHGVNMEWLMAHDRQIFGFPWLHHFTELSHIFTSAFRAPGNPSWLFARSWSRHVVPVAAWGSYWQLEVAPHCRPQQPQNAGSGFCAMKCVYVTHDVRRKMNVLNF